MAIGSGTRLGHYEITGPLGKGGMGEVYRARDTTLGREVAIKVLPSEFSRDEERLARLEREARMLAALNHPNIAAIYGLDQAGDTRFLVLELVEGGTLAERLKAGAIPVEDAIEIGLQVAEAVERPMRRASSTGTSSPPTSRSHPTAGSRSWTSASRRPSSGTTPM